MRSMGRLIAVVLLSSLLAPKASPRVALAGEQKATPVTITVSVAASLKDALTEIAGQFSRTRPDIEVAINSGASGGLELQIEQGAPADIFISAATEEMDKLAAKNLLLNGTRVDLLQNSLVLIVPANSKTVTDFPDLTRKDVRVVALGDPRTVPAGRYGQQALNSLGIYNALKNKLVLATDVRQVLAFVESGNADAGLLYATDAATSPKVKIVAEAPGGSHMPIVYPVAVLRDSQHSDAARAFIAFLKGPGARDVFVKDGFKPAGQ
jgi:molybdate transport system substrate-binding protein